MILTQFFSDLFTSRPAYDSLDIQIKISFDRLSIRQLVDSSLIVKFSFSQFSVLFLGLTSFLLLLRSRPFQWATRKARLQLNAQSYTPNANMADRSVVARNELHESEASWAQSVCFDNSSPGKSCFVVDLVYFVSLCLRVAVSLNANRRDRALPPFAS